MKDGYLKLPTKGVARCEYFEGIRVCYRINGAAVWRQVDQPLGIGSEPAHDFQRRKAGPTAPPHALCLERVLY